MAAFHEYRLFIVFMLGIVAGGVGLKLRGEPPQLSTGSQCAEAAIWLFVAGGLLVHTGVYAIRWRRPFGAWMASVNPIYRRLYGPEAADMMPSWAGGVWGGVIFLFGCGLLVLAAVTAARLITS